MMRTFGILATIASLSISSPIRADDKDATPILEKAIAALGGEAKLAKARSTTSKGTGVLTFGDNKSTVKMASSVEGLDRQRSEIDFEINGMPVKGLTILNGSKAWRRFGDDVQSLDDEQVASTRQGAYLMVVAAKVLPLKSKDFKVEAAPDEKVGDKEVAVVKATGPDGKPFTLYFDKATGLPLKFTATVRGFMGEEVKQETTYAEYKEFDGVKHATKVESKRDGNPFLEMEYTEFKVVDKHDPSTFAEPD